MPGTLNAYVLSMDANFRNANLRQDLEDLGIYVHHVPGPSKDEAISLRNLQFPRFHNYYAAMNLAEMACTLGHRRMYEKSLLNNDRRALFFEDDAIVERMGLQKLIQNIDRLQVDLLLLGTCGGWATRKIDGSLIDSEIAEIMLGSQNGSHAYVATDKAIKDLYLHNSQLERLADSFHRSRKLKLHVCSPFVARQLPDALPSITRSGAARKGFMKSPRRIVTSFVEDLLDLYKFGHFGGRTVNLIELHKIVGIFYKKLPGCR